MTSKRSKGKGNSKRRFPSGMTTKEQTLKELLLGCLLWNEILGDQATSASAA